jgi:hypothetical protein
MQGIASQRVSCVTVLQLIRGIAVLSPEPHCCHQMAQVGAQAWLSLTEPLFPGQENGCSSDSASIAPGTGETPPVTVPQFSHSLGGANLGCMSFPVIPGSQQRHTNRKYKVVEG